jgi:hypothetical protein
LAAWLCCRLAGGQVSGSQRAKQTLIEFHLLPYKKGNNEKEYDRKEKTQRLCVLHYET